MTEATAYGMTDHSWASFAVYPNSLMMVGNWTALVKEAAKDTVVNTHEEAKGVQPSQDCKVRR